MKKSPLKEYYDKLVASEDPRVKFRNYLAKECGVSVMTVYRWIKGEVMPDKLKREKIAQIVGIPVEKLFPYAYIDKEKDTTEKEKKQQKGKQ